MSLLRKCDQCGKPLERVAYVVSYGDNSMGTPPPKQDICSAICLAAYAVASAEQIGVIRRTKR